MIGILMSLCMTIGDMVNSAKDSMQNSYNKKYHRTPDGLTYIDSKARLRLLSNNRIVHYAVDENGDRILIDCLNQRVYRNFTAEEREQRYEKNMELFKSRNNSVYFLDERDNHNRGFECRGVRFYDAETKREYVVRHIEGKYYFMDSHTNEIIRKTDYQAYDEQINPGKYRYLETIDFTKYNKINNNWNKNMFWSSLCDITEIRYLRGNYDAKEDREI